MKSSTKKLAVLAVLVACAPFAVATSADARPFHTGNYAQGLPYEGLYPTISRCIATFREMSNLRTIGTWGGRRITLKYFYSPLCGSFARIDNAAPECVVILDLRDNRGIRRASVGETLHRGQSYAYTMMGNNLSGGSSRGAVVCNGTLVRRTGWL